MKKPNSFLYAFSLLLISSVAIYILSISGTFAYEKIIKPEEILPANTMVGGVQVGGLRISAAETTIEKEIDAWKRQSEIQFVYFDQQIVLPHHAIEFLTRENVQVASKTGTSELTPLVSIAVLEQLLNDQIYDLKEKLALDELKFDIQEKITSLATAEATFNLTDYLREDYQVAEVTVAEALVSPIESSLFLRSWVQALDGFVIEPRQRFSLLQALESQGQAVMKSEDLNMLATGVYQSLMQTNFQLIERNIGRVLPDYVELGYDAVATPGSMDLQFYNPNYYSYELKLTFEARTLRVSVIGKPFPFTYQLKTTDARVVEPRKVVQFSENRRIGDKQIIREGKNGYFVRIYQVIYNQNNELMKEILIAEDYYPPIHKVEEWSLYEQPDLEPQVKDEDEDEDPLQSGNEEEVENGSDNDQTQIENEQIPIYGELKGNETRQGE